MDVELLDAPEVSKSLKRLIDNHDEIHVAVAWGYNGPVADRLLQNAHKFSSVTFGIAFCQTDPNLIDRLVGTKNAFIADGGGRHFTQSFTTFDRTITLKRLSEAPTSRQEG